MQENAGLQDVLARFDQYQGRHPHGRLYALVDGYQYEAHTGERLSGHADALLGLFEGTPDSPLMHAGTWLIDTAQEAVPMARLIELETALPSVTWLFSREPLDLLARALCQRLDITLNGRPALLRFYDPRTLAGLQDILTPEQKTALHADIDEWHLLYQGKRMWIGHGA